MIKIHTVLTSEWIRKELNMGSMANATRALQRYGHSTEKHIKRKEGEFSNQLADHFLPPMSVKSH